MTDFMTYLREVRGGVGASGSPISYAYATPTAAPGTDIDQGEYLSWDATNRVVIRLTGGQPFVGIARDSALSIKKLGNQPALNLRELSAFTTGVHQLLGTAGDVYAHGDVVYLGAGGFGANTIRKASGIGNQLGIVWIEDGTTKTGAVRVPVLIDNFTMVQAGAGATLKG